MCNVYPKLFWKTTVLDTCVLLCDCDPTKVGGAVLAEHWLDGEGWYDKLITGAILSPASTACN